MCDPCRVAAGELDGHGAAEVVSDDGDAVEGELGEQLRKRLGLAGGVELGE